MTDDLIASWNDRISGLHKRGRISADAALATVNAIERADLLRPTKGGRYLLY